MYILENTLLLYMKSGIENEPARVKFTKYILIDFGGSSKGASGPRRLFLSHVRDGSWFKPRRCQDSLFIII